LPGGINTTESSVINTDDKKDTRLQHISLLTKNKQKTVRLM